MGIRCAAPARSRALMGLACVLAAALVGCGGAGESRDGGGSPEQAVEAFLEPLSTPPPRDGGEEDRVERVRALWRSVCGQVDPAIRSGLRPSPGTTIPDAREACGAIATTLALDPGEGGEVGPPSAVSGTARAAVAHGATSVVTVDLRYSPSPNLSAGAPAPPAHATVKALAVKREGRWWVATPEAFNPKHAIQGGMTEPQLRRSYAALLAAAR